MLAAATLALFLATAPAATAHEPGIDWYKGDVQAAFDLAKKDNKPLFLYWGAVWCPPCNQIKKTIFTRREFIEKSKLFLPVYLDGDTESAQKWGEKLGASGYPTMIVYSPQGTEILRMPTGLQVEEFNSVLDQSLGRMTPVAQLLESAIGESADKSAPATKEPGTVPDSTWRVLAYYSWGQDEALKLNAVTREPKFRLLEARVPARLRVEKSRLFTLWLGDALERTKKKSDDASTPAFTLSADERAAARARVLEILAAPDLTLANIEFLLFGAKDVVAGLEPEKGPGRTALEAAWDTAMGKIEANESLSVDERLTSVNPAIVLHQLNFGDDAAVTPALQQRVRKLVEWADSNTKDPYTRQTVLNTAAQLLEDVGLKSEAKALLVAQLDKAVSPHYFMSHLASLAKGAGQKDEAVDWMRKAWETSKGRATRFQWGTSYLQGLMELKPESAELVKSESMRVLGELMAFDDSFSGRNHSRIKRLSKKYAEWNAKDAHKAEIAALRTAFAPKCAGLPDKTESTAGGPGPESRIGRCQGFYEKLGAAN